MGVSFWRNYLGAVIADKMVLAASRVAGAIRLSILVGSCCASSLAHSAHGDGAGSQGHPDLPCRGHADGAFQDRCWFVGLSGKQFLPAGPCAAFFGFYVCVGGQLSGARGEDTGCAVHGVPERLGDGRSSGFDLCEFFHAPLSARPSNCAFCRGGCGVWTDMGLLPTVSEVPADAVVARVRLGGAVYLERREYRDLRDCLGISESEAWMAAGSLRQIWVVVPADDYQLCSSFVGAFTTSAGDNGIRGRDFLGVKSLPLVILWFRKERGPGLSLC